MNTKWYGWKPDMPDGRDKKYQIRKPELKLQSIDLRDKFTMPAIFNQGNLGSCTANAIAYCMAFDVLNNHVQKVDPKCVLPFSRLFIYYNERVLENSVKEDAGAEIRDGFKTIAKEGACLEKYKKYIEHSFARKPSKTAYKQALKFTAIEYERLDNTNKGELVDCLLDKRPFTLGFAVYSSFESDEVARTGIVPMPDYKNDYPVGGHAVACVGYNADTDRFICANSWGDDWAVKGYFTIPAAYLCDANLADDFWVLKSVAVIKLVCIFDFSKTK